MDARIKVEEFKVRILLTDEPVSAGHREQTDRIRENWAEALEEGLENYSLFDLEDLFEDRDPAEFL